MVMTFHIHSDERETTSREPRPGQSTVESVGEQADAEDVSFSNLAGLSSVDALQLRSSLTPIHSVEVTRPRDIEIDSSGNYAVVVFNSGVGNGGLSIIDISDPDTPQLVGDTLVGERTAIVINGDFAYTSGTTPTIGGGGRLAIVDISDTTNPTVVGADIKGSQLFSLDVDNAATRAYCADTFDDGVVLFDITDKTNPTPIPVDAAATGFGAGNARLDESRNILFVTDFENHKLKVFDTQSNPPLAFVGEVSLSLSTLPVYIATLDPPQNLAFVSEFEGEKIAIIDIADPVNMQEIDTLFVNAAASTAWQLEKIHADNGKLYVSYAEGGGPLSSGDAFISVIPYTRNGFQELDRFFHDSVLEVPKVLVGQPNVGPIDGFTMRDGHIYATLLNANIQRGALVIIDEISPVIIR